MPALACAPSSSALVRSREDESVLFRHRCRLFTMAPSAGGKWKEEGTGDIKVVFHTKTGRTRLTMRKSELNTTILNQLVQQHAALVPARSEGADGSGAAASFSADAGRAFVFESEDWASGARRRETFAVRFKAEEPAAEFARAYAEAQVRNHSVFTAESAVHSAQVELQNAQEGGAADGAASPGAVSASNTLQNAIAHHSEVLALVQAQALRLASPPQLLVQAQTQAQAQAQAHAQAQISSAQATSAQAPSAQAPSAQAPSAQAPAAKAQAVIAAVSSPAAAARAAPPAAPVVPSSAGTSSRGGGWLWRPLLGCSYIRLGRCC
jgi:hypothetical protein